MTLINDFYQQAPTVLSEYSITLTLLLALFLDKILGEAKHFHYLVGFGWLANKLEKRLNPFTLNVKENGVDVKSEDRKSTILIPPTSNKATLKARALQAKLRGTFAWCLLVLPLPIIYFYSVSYLTENSLGNGKILLDALVLYLAIGLNSLHVHAMQIYQPLTLGKLDIARLYTGYIVSRETSSLSSQEMSRATVESMLENGHDSVIASLIYFIIGGTPLVILHRFANTLDAMWGYKNAKFTHFGYASAKLDDLLGLLSGKCCTLLYAIQGDFNNALVNAYQQGNQYKSHNGGWVMAAGATVMKIKLGGSALYHGEKINTVILGCGNDVTTNDIPNSLTIISRASLLLVAIVFIVQLLLGFK